MDVGSEAISEALREECDAEFAAGVGTSPWRLEELALKMVAAASAVEQPANDALTDGGAWTYAERLARAYSVTVIERPRGSPGQYGGAVARRGLCWIVSGLPIALRESLKTHEVTHVASARDALSEGAVWWLTIAQLYPQSIAAAPRTLGDLYLGGAHHYPRWIAERRWQCLEILAAAHDEAV